jgi:hypothetical protein
MQKKDISKFPLSIVKNNLPEGYYYLNKLNMDEGRFYVLHICKKTNLEEFVIKIFHENNLYYENEVKIMEILNSIDLMVTNHVSDFVNLMKHRYSIARPA